MARIIGTPGPDQLKGTVENDLIRGRGGDDAIHGSLGDDRIYGDDGNDSITDYDGRNEIRGGRGDDTINISRGYAYGGVGDDFIGVYGGGAWAIGGKGNDRFEGSGLFVGDEELGRPERVAGNDTFLMYADADSVRAHGGLGADQFYLSFAAETPGIAIIDDFHSGEDKLQIFIQPPDGESAIDLFGVLDANHNGILEYTDALSGGRVWVDSLAETMILGTGTGPAIIHGTTQIAASDWLFDFGA